MNNVRTAKHSLGKWVALVFVAAGLAGGVARAQVIYVDGGLKEDCKGAYSIAKRDSSGTGGDAYNAIGKAANVANAGDTVLIREGVYHRETGPEDCDVLWPKHSGEPGKPIVFKAYNGEKAVLGQGSQKYPCNAADNISIARAVVTLKNVNWIAIEDLTFSKVEGWVYARGCNNITFKNCAFEEARNEGKGTTQFLECTHCKLMHCSFLRSMFDVVQINKGGHHLIEDCTFSIGAHCCLAIRGSSFNVVRNCRFKNAFFENGRAEKLIEVYDIRLDRRGPDNPSCWNPPVYDGTKYNLFEHNYFGYHPFIPKSAGQTSAFQYTGQNGIFRCNVFCNPPLKQPDPDYPQGEAGGVAIAMRWGGSWDGWNPNKQYWMGEACEAGYNTHNRVFNNTFVGYDSTCVWIPADNVIADVTINPPPLENKFPSKQFDHKFAFEDNIFKNNIFCPSLCCAHGGGSILSHITGKPVAVVVMGLFNKVCFEHNDFFAPGEHADELIYCNYGNYPPPINPAAADNKFPKTFLGNLQKDPQFVNADEKDFRLQENSPMRGAGTFLTATEGEGKNTTKMKVKDAGYFCDGFGIEGLQGDLIQLKGQSETVRIIAVDYAQNLLTLDKPLSWENGLGVSLPYAGAAPNVGAH